MFDHLSAEPPEPAPGALDAVHARARVLKRRTWFAAGGGTAAGLAVVVTVVVLASGPGPERSSLVVADDPTVTETSAVEVTVGPVESSAAPTARPSETATASPLPQVVPTPSPTPSPSCSSMFEGCPDGKPGWGTGFTGCHDATASELPSGTSRADLFDGVTAVLDVPDVASGSVGKVAVTVLNDRDETVRLNLLLSPQEQAVVVGGAQHFTDALLGPRPFTIEPGQSVALDLPLRATSCGDTAEDPEPGLQTGSHEAGVTLSFDGATTASPSPDPLVDPSPRPTSGPVTPQGQVGLRAAFQVT